jgi:hypothetical protein
MAAGKSDGSAASSSQQFSNSVEPAGRGGDAHHVEHSVREGSAVGSPGLGRHPYNLRVQIEEPGRDVKEGKTGELSG